MNLSSPETYLNQVELQISHVLCADEQIFSAFSVLDHYIIVGGNSSSAKV
jgi:hypothetical protein